MLIHFEIEYCLTGQLITLTERSIYTQMIEKAGQIGLTRFVIKFRFAVRSVKIRSRRKLITTICYTQRRSGPNETKKSLPERKHHFLSSHWSDIRGQWQCRQYLQKWRAQERHIQQGCRADLLQELRRVPPGGRKRSVFGFELQGRSAVGEIDPRESGQPDDAAMACRPAFRRIPK